MASARAQLSARLNGRPRSDACVGIAVGVSLEARLAGFLPAQGPLGEKGERRERAASGESGLHQSLFDAASRPGTQSAKGRPARMVEAASPGQSNVSGRSQPREGVPSTESRTAPGES